MKKYTNKNAKVVLENVEGLINLLESLTDDEKRRWFGFEKNGFHLERGKFRMREVCSPLSIFDWWNDTLSLSQLKQMRTFLKTAISLGFNGYVCFKVGAAGCANGMWAHTETSKNGFSPNTGECLYHSFVSTDNYFDYCSDCATNEWHNGYEKNLKLKDIKQIIKNEF